MKTAFSLLVFLTLVVAFFIVTAHAAAIWIQFGCQIAADLNPPTHQLVYASALTCISCAIAALLSRPARK